MLIITKRLIYLGLGMFAISILLTFPPNALAFECFSSPPSVENGRGVFEQIRPRDLVGDEYRNLEGLLQSLSGRWTGNAEVEVCRDTGDEIITEMEEFSIESKIDFRRTGQFSINSKLSSREKGTKHQNTISLCLNRNRLSTVCNMAVSDIELTTATDDNLAYVRKTSKRPDRLNGVGGSDRVREAITAIQKIDETSFAIEKLIYLQGKLITKETWQLEMR